MTAQNNAAYEALAIDLFRRTEKAIEEIACLAVDTRITFQIKDIVDRVEEKLPPGYADSATPGARRDLIAEMARDSLSGEAYED
uniref:hypothetical protein n=1 Tax=unclassified Streptomyces TaxID=2593676 RepID=UPI003F493C42